MRVVLDTNIVVSRTLSELGCPALIVRAWHTQEVALEIIVSEWLLDEYERVLNYPRIRRRHGKSPAEVRELVDEVRQFGVLVEPADVPAVIPQDPDDDYGLACAVAGDADYIISGDPDLLELGAYQGIRILTPATFVRLLEQERREREE
jgi:putative PIN family toxin of toxin-antitoxin system